MSKNRVRFLQYAVEADDALWWERVELWVRTRDWLDIITLLVCVFSVSYTLIHFIIWWMRGFRMVG